MDYEEIDRMIESKVASAFERFAENLTFGGPEAVEISHAQIIDAAHDVTSYYRAG